MSRSEAAETPQKPRTEHVKDVRCPCCKHLLMKALADGTVETKCKNCRRIIRLKLTR